MDELIKLNHSTAILIHLLEQLQNLFICRIQTNRSEKLSKLTNINISIIIVIKTFKFLSYRNRKLEIVCIIWTTCRQQCQLQFLRPWCCLYIWKETRFFSPLLAFLFLSKSCIWTSSRTWNSFFVSLLLFCLNVLKWILFFSVAKATTITNVRPSVCP